MEETVLERRMRYVLESFKWRLQSRTNGEVRAVLVGPTMDGLEVAYQFYFNGSVQTLKISVRTLLQTTSANTALLGSVHADTMIKVLGYEKVRLARELLDL